MIKLLMMKQFSIMFFLLFVGSSINAQIITIPNDQPTIQDGINIASNGDTIIVNPGTYVENINFNGKKIVLASRFLTTNDTSYISQTIIDGNQNGSVVTFENYEDSLSVISGFTITNGSGKLINNQIYYGGGISCDSANPKLQYLYITGNTVNGNGGGIYALNSSMVIENVAITNNSATISAGGIYFDNSFNIDLENNPKSKMSHSLVKNNSAVLRGGGIYCDYTIVTLSKIEITNNIANNGGAFYLGNAKLILTSSTVSNNTASNQGGIIYLDGSESILINSILWNNNPQNIYLFPDPGFSTVTMAFSNVQGGPSIVNSDGVLNWENGNIDSDPLFISNNDYNLQNNSPSIDTGTSFFEWQSDTIINLMSNEYLGLAPDMGAYEYGIISNIEETGYNASNDLLFEIYPNPSEDIINIDYYLPHSSMIEISLLNSVGRHIKTLVSANQRKGKHQITEILDNISAGTYFVNIQTDKNISKTLLIIKK